MPVLSPANYVSCRRYVRTYVCMYRLSCKRQFVAARGQSMPSVTPMRNPVIASPSARWRWRHGCLAVGEVRTSSKTDRLSVSSSGRRDRLGAGVDVTTVCGVEFRNAGRRESYQGNGYCILGHRCRIRMNDKRVESEAVDAPYREG